MLSKRQLTRQNDNLEQSRIVNVRERETEGVVAKRFTDAPADHLGSAQAHSITEAEFAREMERERENEAIIE